MEVFNRNGPDGLAGLQPRPHRLCSFVLRRARGEKGTLVPAKPVVLHLAGATDAEYSTNYSRALRSTSAPHGAPDRKLRLSPSQQAALDVASVLGSRGGASGLRDAPGVSPEEKTGPGQGSHQQPGAELLFGPESGPAAAEPSSKPMEQRGGRLEQAAAPEGLGQLRARRRTGTRPRR